MQIKNGTANVVQTSATVTGSGTTWLADVSIGDYFIKAGDALPIVYTVGGIVSDTQLTLTAPYGGSTESGIAYVVHRDFFPNGNAQLFSTDVETAGIFNESAKNSIVTADTTTSPDDATGILRAEDAYGSGSRNWHSDNPVVNAMTWAEMDAIAEVNRRNSAGSGFSYLGTVSEA